MQSLKEFPVIRPLLRLLNSSKFWAVFFAALASSGLDISAEWRAFIILIGGVVYAMATAYEDGKAKGG